MALAEVSVPIPFAGGVNTKQDRKLVPPVQLLALENGVFDKSTSIQKRNGYTGLSKDLDIGGQYTTPNALAARGDELCLFADRSLFSYRTSTGTWSKVGPAQSIVHREDPVAATGTDQSMPDIATYGGVTLVAWEDSRGGVWWSVVEASGGRVLRPAEQANANWTKPRCCRNGDRLHLYAVDAAAGRIWVMVVNPTDYLATITPLVLTSTLSTTFPFYDAEFVSFADSQTVIGWVTATGYSLAYVTPSGGQASSPASRGDNADTVDGPIAVSPLATDATIAVATVNGFDVVANVYDSTDLTAPNDGPTTVLTCTAEPERITITRTANGPSNGQVLWTWAEDGGGDPQFQRISVGAYLVGGTVAQSISVARGHGLVSRAFVDDGQPYAVIVHEGTFFPYAALTRAYLADPDVLAAPLLTCVGRLTVGSSDGLPTQRHVVSAQQDPDDERVWRVPLLARELLDVQATQSQFTETGIRIATLDFDSTAAFQAVEVGRDLIVAGAVPLRYDGDTVAELSFHTAPELDSADVTGTASGTGLAAGTYLYFFCYEEVDAQGVIHPGAVSVGNLVTVTGAHNGVLAVVPTYHLTGKRRVRIGVFRTEVNDTAGDAPAAYRVSSLDPNDVGAFPTPNTYLLNDDAADTVTFLDCMSDAVLVTRERLYTNNIAAPGILSNDPIGLGAVVTTGKDRLFFTAPEDGSLIRYSQAARDGYGPELPADLSIPIDPYGGDVTALAVLDDAVVVFKAGAIYAFTGPGPLPNPDAAPQVGFSAPQLITSDVGCSSPASIAVTPVGVLFQTSRGIYMLSRERQVSYIGANVEAFNDQRLVSANPLPGRTQIVFLTDSGMSLLFDYFHGQWSWFTNHEGLDATVCRGTYFYLRANPVDYRVFQETPGEYLDGTVDIRLYLETAWIKLAQYAQGWQKVWWAHLLGDWLSPHALEVRFAIDYRDAWLEPYTLDVDTDEDPANYGEGNYGDGVFGGDPDSGVLQKRIHVGLKCQALKVGISDVRSVVAPTAPLGASFTLSELLLTGGALTPAVKLGPSRSS